jgi:tetratricopeptide (TPR) repeat protein
MLFAVVVVLGAASLSARAQDWDRAVSLYNQKQYRPAIKEFHAVLRANASAWQSWYYIGASHYQLQSYEDTIDAFQNYLKAGEKDDKVQAAGNFFIGMSLYQLKQYDKAAPSLARYIDIAQKTQQKIEPSARATLGRAYMHLQRYNEAIPVLTASAAEIKGDATTYYLIGFANHKLGRADQAITALNQGLGISPRDPDTLSLLTEVYYSQLRQNPAVIKQVISAGERLIAVRDDERSWVLLGQAYLIDKQFAKAAPLLDKYARAHKDSSSAWYNLGLAYSRSSQWKPAAEALEQSIKIEPAALNALLELGYVYESDNQFDKALVAYERAFEASGRRDETARAGIDRINRRPKS